MKLPVKLCRTPSQAEQADAYLLLDVADDNLGEILARLTTGQVPQLFRVHGGILIVPIESKNNPSLGLLRLRRIAAHFYIPVDAEISPAIHADEFVGLCQGAGIVLLPDRGLAFDAASPIPVSEWLRLPPRQQSLWKSFPSPLASPDELHRIERPAPPTKAEDLLRGGEPDGRSPLPSINQSGEPTEDARPPSGKLITRIGARTALGFGKGLAWFGHQIGAESLVRAGANLARRAVDSVPRLSERILGAQEAALRKLLRELQSGDTEKAMRKAPIAVGDPNASIKIDGGSSLHDRDIGYSFASLFRGGGVSSAWLGGGDVWALLQAEYRRLAAEAVKRGDYRRAAYIFGILLRDLRAAANVLNTGGLHRDAALLLRDRLNDPLGAAHAFEQAGDFDEALRLFEKQGEDLKAAEMLRRIGDETRAEHYYLSAAKKLASRNERLQAGDLVLAKLGRSDLADKFFREGWQGEFADKIVCGHRLIDNSLLRGDAEEFDRLVEEASIKLAHPALDKAGQFFNYVLEVSPQLLPPNRLADLRDQVRLTFADHLRDRQGNVGPGSIHTLFGKWSSSIRRDAGYAVSQVVPKAESEPTKSSLIATGKVRAVAESLEEGVIFVGTSDQIVAWYVETGLSYTIATCPSKELLGLCSSRSGKQLFSLCDCSTHLELTSYMVVPKTSRILGGGRSITIPISRGEGEPEIYFQPSFFESPQPNCVVVCVDGIRRAFDASTLTECPPPRIVSSVGVTHWIGQVRDTVWDWSDNEIICYDSSPENAIAMRSRRDRLGWTPARHLGHTAASAISPDENTLVLVGVDGEGVLHRSELSFGRGASQSQQHSICEEPHLFVAATLLRTNAIAAVTQKNQILLLRRVGSKLLNAGTLGSVDPATKIIFLSYKPESVIAVLENGTVTKFPYPAEAGLRVKRAE